jgi:hypothetical protein
MSDKKVNVVIEKVSESSNTVSYRHNGTSVATSKDNFPNAKPGQEWTVVVRDTPAPHGQVIDAEHNE